MRLRVLRRRVCATGLPLSSISSFHPAGRSHPTVLTPVYVTGLHLYPAVFTRPDVDHPQSCVRHRTSIAVFGRTIIHSRAPRRAAMALSKLSGDEQGILFTQLCNVLDPRLAMALSSISNELRTATQEGRQQLRADHEAAAALCLKVGLRGCCRA